MSFNPDAAPPTPNRLATVAFLTVCLLWGTGYLAIRVGALEKVPPFLFMGLRVLGAGVLLLLVATRGDWRKLPRTKNTLLPLAVVGLLTEGVGNGVLGFATRFVSSGLTALLMAMTTFYALGIEAALPRGERPTPTALLGLIVGFAGLVYLVLPDFSQAGGRGFLVGVALIQVVCLFYAAGSVAIKRMGQGDGNTKPDLGTSLIGAGIQEVIAGGLLTLIGTFAGEWNDFYFSPAAWGAFWYLLLIPSGVGFAAYIYSLQHLPLSVVTLHRYINPVVALLVGAWLLHETVTGRDVVAIAIIAAGVGLVQWGQTRR
ncbi:MAG: EamA family transporter [Fibrella sp.]|nr:EamA family transporter [Armatimonadota bacterium]